MKIKNYIKSLEKKYGVSERTVYNKVRLLNINLKRADIDELNLLERALEESLKLTNKNKSIIKSSQKAINNYYSINAGELTTLERLYEDTKNEYEYNENLIINLQKQINELSSLLQENRNGSISVNTLINTLKEYTKNNKGLREQFLELENQLAEYKERKNMISPIGDE